jgi:hypothetical protein
MSDVTEAFEELLDEHRRIGSPTPAYLTPGRDPEEVRRELVSLGIEPSLDVIEYFTVQDGIDDASWVAEHRGAPFLCLYPLYESPSLTDLGRAYRVMRDVSVRIHGDQTRIRAEIPEVGYWARSWVPIFIGGSRCLAADCRGGVVSAIWGQATHPGYEPTRPLYGSLAELLHDVAGRLRSGAILWRPDLNAYDVDAQAVAGLDAALPARPVETPTTDRY